MRETRRDEEEVALGRIGEVVESASHRLTAQCYRLYDSPPLGAFVRTGSSLVPLSGADGANETSATYAVVCGVSTQSLDLARRPVVARGEEMVSEEDVYRANPQLERLLCTRFEALIVGHADGASFHHYLPALPPRVHAFVYPCTPEEVGRFTGCLDFLYLLANTSPVGRGITDEVIAACLRQVSMQVEDPRSFLLRAGKSLAAHLADDLPRLNAILKRLSQ